MKIVIKVEYEGTEYVIGKEFDSKERTRENVEKYGTTLLDAVLRKLTKLGAFDE